jgi:hypothetical protein
VLSTLSFTGEVKISLAGNPKDVVPYAIAGGGVTRMSQAASTMSISYLGQPFDRETSPAELTTKTTTTVGVGVDVPVRRRVRVFVEARYRMIFRHGERLEYLGLRAGARIGLW